nr:MAG TPA: hypothetical protein [Caudoviricetes sp.]
MQYFLTIITALTASHRRTNPPETEPTQAAYVPGHFSGLDVAEW